MPPSLSGVKALTKGPTTELTLSGDHLALAQEIENFPIAVLNDTQVSITTANDQEMTLKVDSDLMKEGVNKLKVALDPYALMTVEIET